MNILYRCDACGATEEAFAVAYRQCEKGHVHLDSRPPGNWLTHVTNDGVAVSACNSRCAAILTIKFDLPQKEENNG